MKPVTIRALADSAGVVEAIEFYERKGLVPRPLRPGTAVRSEERVPHEQEHRAANVLRPFRVAFVLCGRKLYARL